MALESLLSGEKKKKKKKTVQENCIDLVGRIADRASEAVPAREWARISQKLIDLLKAHKKAIRRAAVNTFGYIAKAIGPLDVMTTLLNNLKVCLLRSLKHLKIRYQDFSYHSTHKTGTRTTTTSLYHHRNRCSG